MVTFVDHQDIPWARLDDALSVIAINALVDARNDQTIRLYSRIRRRPCDPYASIQIELIPKFSRDVPNQARGGQIENAQRRTLIGETLDDQASFDRLPEA